MGFIVKILFFPFKLLRWLSSWIVWSIVLALLISLPAEGISARQAEAISTNCGTIKKSLDQLQKVDSRTRTYLGTTYETIANKFITPLNLRLVKNNLPTLSIIQSDFSSEQGKFREAFTNYMRELESLIAIDCQAHPEDFYKQLEVVRVRRTSVRTSANKLSGLADNQYRAVVELRDSL